MGRNAALQSLTGDAAEASYLGDPRDLRHRQREDRHRARRHADRDHRLQGGRQVLRRAQQRVRLRQLRDRPEARRAEPARRRVQHAAVRAAARAAAALPAARARSLFAAYTWLHRGAGQRATRRVASSSRRTICGRSRIAWLAQGRPAPTPEEMQQSRRERGCARRSSIARRWRSASTRTTRSSSAGWRRRWSSCSRTSARAARAHERRAARPGSRRTPRASRCPRARRFRHLYFSPDRRGPRAREDAAHALTKLAGKPDRLAGAAAALADPLHVPGLLRRPFARRRGQDVRPAVRARRSSSITPGAWRGPDRVGLRLASRVRRFAHAGARAGLRGGRAGRQDGDGSRSSAPRSASARSRRCSRTTRSCCRRTWR